MTGDEIPNISFEEALTGYELKFTPTDAGVYLAEIKLTDAQIKGSPVTVNVMTEEQYHTRASNSLSGGVVPRASSDTTKVRDYTQSINANSLNNGNSMPARNSNGANSTSNPSMKTEVHTATTKQPVISYTLAPKTVTATTSHQNVDASEVDCTFTDPAGDRIVDDIDIEPIIDKKNSDSIIDRFNLVFTPSMKGRYTCLFKSPDGSEIGKLEIDVIVKTPKAKIVQLNGDGESWLIQCCFQEEF
eukprot:TRINITY_DN622_c0_g2_i4.p1 TRINITY_DN622_c0_g2~~TRINITY_DN622_c0_g2_i4.p1  ORF type:complete len:245 (-),score=54.68 TRINITY_DN622_c0_g2_i4:1193-1927(-)